MDHAKILFLDFDDVLNTARTLERGELFEGENVRALNAILDRTGVKIVITSNWRFGATPQELEDVLVDAGVHARKRVVGVTPSLDGCSRGAEIEAWLDQAPIAVSDFVILDNRSDMESCRRQLVLTDPRYGLNFSQVDKVVGLLGEAAA